MLKLLIEMAALCIPQSPKSILRACENLDGTLSLPDRNRRHWGKVRSTVVSVIVVIIDVAFVVVGHHRRRVNHGMHLDDMSEVTIIVVLAISCCRPSLART